MLHSLFVAVQASNRSPESKHEKLRADKISSRMNFHFFLVDDSKVLSIVCTHSLCKCMKNHTWELHMLQHWWRREMRFKLPTAQRRRRSTVGEKEKEESYGDMTMNYGGEDGNLNFYGCKDWWNEIVRGKFKFVRTPWTNDMGRDGGRQISVTLFFCVLRKRRNLLCVKKCG